MTGIFKDVSAHALRLRLYAGSVEFPDAAVFSRGRAACGELEIDARVIGASHVMEVRRSSLALTELLACDAPPAAQPLVLWQPGDTAVEYAGWNSLSYRFEASVLELDNAGDQLPDLRDLIRHANQSRSQIGLAFRFPSRVDGPWTAETLVWAAVHPEGVTARTAHSYPSEGLVAISSTTITIAAGAENTNSARAVAV